MSDIYLCSDRVDEQGFRVPFWHPATDTELHEAGWVRAQRYDELLDEREGFRKRILELEDEREDLKERVRQLEAATDAEGVHHDCKQTINRLWDENNTIQKFATELQRQLRETKQEIHELRISNRELAAQIVLREDEDRVRG